MAPLPGTVNDSALSPRSLEVLGQVGLRLTAGFPLQEVASVLDQERPELKHLRLPPKVTKTLVCQRLRELRHEMEAALAP